MSSISVIIPAYNSAATIVEALESVWAQTCPVEEVIVVDDASTDNTVEVARRWMADRAVVGRWSVVVCGANGGPAAARNRGVAEAGGEWLAFLDADDLWLPSKTAAQRAFIEAHPDVALCCGGRLTLGVGGTPQVPAGGDAGAWRAIDRIELAKYNPVVTSTVVLRKKVFEDTGGFDPRFRGPEDYDLWIRVAARGSMAMLTAPLACYRHRPGSLSLDERRFLPQVLRVLDKAYAAGGGLSDMPEWRHASVSTQWQQASWMAFCRGSRAAAVRHLVTAWGWMITGRRRVSYPWVALLYRYVAGRRPEEGAR